MLSLEAAIYDNNLKEIQELLTLKKSTGVTSDYTTYLMLALGSKAFDIAKAFIEAGADINHLALINNINYTLLHCYLGDIDCVKFLSENCPSIINAYGDLIDTPLTRAIALNMPKTVEVLCQNKADVNIPNKLGILPLHCAITYNYFPLATYLVQQGANIFSVPKETYSFLQNSKDETEQAFYKDFLTDMSNKLSQENTIMTLNLEAIKNIPFHLLHLNANVTDLIKRQLKQLLSVSNLPLSIIQKLISNLEKKTQIRNINLLNIISEISQIVTNPHLVDEGEFSLCGPASFIRMLAKNSPDAFINVSLQLAVTGKVKISLFSMTLSQYSLNQAVSFTSILLIEIKRASNYLGYSPNSWEALDILRAATGSKMLTSWLKAFHYREITDLTFLLSQTDSQLSTPLNLLVNIVASWGLQQQGCTVLSKIDNLKMVCEEIEKGKKAIFFLSADFMNKLEEKKFPGVKFSKSYNFIPHFVYLNKLQLIEDKKIQFEFMTFGTTFIDTMNITEFLSGYLGAITAFSPQDKKRNVPNEPKVLLDLQNFQLRGGVLSNYQAYNGASTITSDEMKMILHQFGVRKQNISLPVAPGQTKSNLIIGRQ